MADINVINDIIDVNVTEEVITVAAGNGAYPLAYPVYTVFGRTGNVVSAEGDYSLTQLSDVTLSSPTNGQVLKYNGTNWVNTTIGDYVPYTGATSDLNLGTNNIYANNLFEKFVSVTASGTQLVLTIGSAPSMVVSGSGGQTIKLPNATTLPNGATYYFNNNQSSGVINVNNNSNTLVKSAQSGSYLVITLLDNSIAAGSWDAHFEAPSNVSWSTNTLDYAGSITSATWNGNTVQPNKGGTGQLSYTDGQILIGNSTGNTLSKSTLTAGTGISITNGAGAITIASSLTNPITGTGTINTLSKFTGTTALGNSQVFDDGTTVSIGTAVSSTSKFVSYLSTNDINTYSIFGWGTGTNTSGILSVVDSGNIFVGQGNVSSVNGQRIVINNAGVITLATWNGVSITDTYISSASTWNAKIGGTGTTNTIPKFSGSSTIGNSNITDSGTLITLGSNSYVNGLLGIGVNPTYRLDILGANVAGVADISSFAIAGNGGSGRGIGIILASGGSSNSVQVARLVGFQETASATANNASFAIQVANTSGTLTEYLRLNNIGSLGLGTTSLTGYALRVSKTITGATTAHSIYQDGQIQSGVTTQANYNYTIASTINTVFTLSSLAHYQATQGTFGASSTVTSQFGFLVASSLTGATNNYAFYGNLASAANVWNLYMGGTASNYMAGSLGIGTTTIGANLHIKTALSTASSEEIALRVESSPTGGTADRQIELVVKNDGTAANTYGLIRLGDQSTNAGSPASVILSAGGDSFFRNGALGIGTYGPSCGPITAITLTNGGSGYVDGTYTNIVFTSNGQALYATATYVVSGGIVTSATLVNSGSNYYVGITLTTANTNLGGTGSGLVVTVTAVDSSLFRIQNSPINNSSASSDISLFHYQNTTLTDEGLGFIKWETTDASTAAAGIQAKFGVYSASATGGAYFTFATRTSASNILTERVRIDQNGAVGIGTTTIGSKLQVNGNAAIGYSASTAAATNGLSVAGTTNIGTNTSVTTALLQVSSTTQGFLPPVMTTTQKNAITSPATGLVVFDSTLGKLCVFSTTWQTITSV